MKSIPLFDSASLARVAALFPNLEPLFISTNRRGSRYPDLSTDDNIGIAAIRVFDPLKYLHLRGFRSVSSLHRIVQHHGSSLHGIIVVPCSRDKARRTPSSDQTIQGYQGECEMYKTLGKFSNLYIFVLDLHFDSDCGGCTNFTYP